METIVYRTAQQEIKDPALIKVFKAQCLSSKNIKNTGIFIIRNILSSFENGKLKTELHQNQLGGMYNL